MTLTSQESTRQMPTDAGHPLTAALDWLTRPLRRRAVHRLRSAAESADTSLLASLLDPGVSVVVDSGDAEHPTVRVVGGIHDATTLLIHGMSAKAGVVVEERPVNGQAGLMLSRGRRTVAAVTVDFVGPLVSLVWVRLQPAAA